MNEKLTKSVARRLEQQMEGAKFILRDCGCYAILNMVEQTAHIEYCAVHGIAEEMLEAIRSVLDVIVFLEDDGTIESMLINIIDRAEGV